MTLKSVSRALFFQLIVVCLVLYLYAEIFSGEKSLINNSDSYDQSFMWMSKVFEAARNYELVLWDFTTQSGVSFVGELQPAPFYLPSLLLAYLPMDFYNYFHFFIFTHTLISVIGFFILLKKYGLYTSAATIGSLLFAFSLGIIDRSVGQVNIYASLAWMPFIVCGLDYIFTGKSRVNLTFGVVVMSVSASMSFYAGHTHPLVIGATVGVLLSVARNCLATAIDCELNIECKWTHRMLALFISLILFVVLSLPQLIPTVEYMYLTYKWYGPGFTKFPHTVPVTELTNIAINFSDLKSLFWPSGLSVPGASMYLGAGCWLTIGLSILTNALSPKSQKTIQALRFQAVVALASVLLVIFAFGLVYYNFPILSNVRIPGRWGFGVVFLLCILYAISLDSIVRTLRASTERLSERFSSHGVSSRLYGYLISGAVVCVSLWYVALISQDNMERVKKNSYENNSALNAEKTPHFIKLKELMGNDNKNGNGWRFFASRELIPPNIGNKYEFMFSSNGFRSSRTISYHKYFDFQPLGEHLKSLSVKYWVDKGGNKLLGGLVPLFEFDDDIKIYELPDVFPILRNSDYSAANIQTDIMRYAKIKFRSNYVEFNFDKEVGGNFIFSSIWYPGFHVETPHEKVDVIDKGDLMSFSLTKPTNSIVIKYQPSYFCYIAYFYAIVVILALLLFYRIRQSSKTRSWAG